MRAPAEREHVSRSRLPAAAGGRLRLRLAGNRAWLVDGALACGRDQRELRAQSQRGELLGQRLLPALRLGLCRNVLDVDGCSGEPVVAVRVLVVGFNEVAGGRGPGGKAEWREHTDGKGDADGDAQAAHSRTSCGRPGSNR